jgi:oxygen-independent coproporphyrinogen-3 oxidase
LQHIYLHVPFCARRCSYCDFSIAVRKTIPAERYLEAVASEVDLRRRQGGWNDEPTGTLYLGGGTPSLLPAGTLQSLVALFVAADAAAEVEITLEANPDDVTERSAAAWKAAGVNRVSLGAQSFSDAVLAWMHRTHDAAAVPRSVGLLRGAGIDNISLDLIFGLPEELRADFDRDLSAALELDPAHMSVYGLSVEERTPLARWISRGATTAPHDERYVREFLQAHERLTAAGFEHYEVSNYARPNRRSRHNSAYWTERPYAGLGPAAHSFDGTERRWNIDAWAAYDRALAEGRDPTAERERLSPESRWIERVYLGLRTSDGFSHQLPRNVEAKWAAQGWLERAGQTLRLTPEGWLRLDEIVAVLTTSAVSG